MGRFCVWGMSLLVSTCLLSSCGGDKVLTPDRATALAQARLDGDVMTHGTIAVNISALTIHMNVRIPAQAAELPPAMQRLLKLGYLEQQTIKISYPDLTGLWRGPTPIPNTLPGQEFEVQLSMNRNDRPPTVSGIHGGCDPGGRCYIGNPDSRVSGVVTAEPPYQLAVSEQSGLFFTAVVSLQRSPSGDALVGKAVFAPGGSIAVFGHPESPLNLRSTAGHGSIDQDMYLYKWASKFPPEALMGSNDVKLGHVEADGCDRLLLGSSDTNASGVVKWHIDLKDPQKSLMGTERLEGTVPATFRKQPDGKWAVDSMEGINVRMPM